MSKLLADFKRREKQALPRWKRVAEMRDKGMTLREIGDAIGVCPSRAHYLLCKFDSWRIKQISPVHMNGTRLLERAGRCESNHA